MKIFSFSYTQWLLAVWLCVFSNTSLSNGDFMRIAVASNFVEPLREIVSAFEAQYDASVKISAASSGKHYAQIRHGAPFDVFLSADEDKVDRLISSGQVLATDSLIYSQGLLALYSNKPQFWPVTLKTLQHTNVRLAIANPKLAPYGLAAKSLLDNIKLDPSTRIITGENIAQTFHFIHSGGADIGLVALSQLMQTQAHKQYHLIPIDSYPPILQKAAVLSASHHIKEARRFLAFLSRETARSIIQSYGYQTP